MNSKVTESLKSVDSIYIRAEIYENEIRCPIIPVNVKDLINAGFTVYVQHSISRCYKDLEFKKYGAIIVRDHWSLYKDSLIIGLKELDNINKLNNHVHLYFSHSFKNQKDSKNILLAFKNTKSYLYDLEYFTDSTNQRIISFGFYAGFVGSALGIMQYCSKQLFSKNISNLVVWNSIDELYSDLTKYLDYLLCTKIAVIGPNGRSGSGAISLLNHFNIPYIVFLRNDNKNNLIDFDIVINCICLDNDNNCIKPWFTKNTIFKNKIVIVDVSCDYATSNNPIQIYNTKTTWEQPVYSYNDNVDIIAIENLPSLLPYDSSNFFSNKLTELLLTYKTSINSTNNTNYWKKCINVFFNNIKYI
jgi:saccharopine dehydrogenase (NAD+, L-lysine-forming)